MDPRTDTINCINFYNLFKNQDASAQEEMLRLFTAAVTIAMNRAIFRIIISEDKLVIRFHYKSIASYKMDDGEDKGNYKAYQFTFREGQAELIQGVTSVYPDLKQSLSLKNCTVVNVSPTQHISDHDQLKLCEEVNDYLKSIVKEKPSYMSQSSGKQKHRQVYPVTYTKMYGEALNKIEDASHELMKLLKKELKQTSGTPKLETAVQQNYFSKNLEWHREAKYYLECLAQNINEIIQEDPFPKRFTFKDPESSNQLFQIIYYALLIVAKLQDKNDNKVVFALLVKLRDAYEIEAGILPSKRDEKDWTKCESSCVNSLTMAKKLLQNQRAQFRKQNGRDPVKSYLISMTEEASVVIKACAWQPRLLPQLQPAKEDQVDMRTHTKTRFCTIL